MTEPVEKMPRASMAERAVMPEILWPEDIARLLGLPSGRAAREFIRREGIPHVRVLGRVFVRKVALKMFFKDREERRPTRREIREKAAEDIRKLAPTLRERQLRHAP